jgi:DNA polymerase III alpha subunit
MENIQSNPVGDKMAPTVSGPSVLPIFYDDSSYKSVLTWDDPKEALDGGPYPIMSLLKHDWPEAGGAKDVFFVSNRFISFVRAKELCEKNKVGFSFGLEIWVTNRELAIVSDAKKEKKESFGNELSRKNESKIIVRALNSEGYKDLIVLYRSYMMDRTDYYYHNRTTWDKLKTYWTKNLQLCIPFFDSFVAKNLLSYGAAISPDLSFASADGQSIWFFKEVGSGHVHESLIARALDSYLASLAGNPAVVLIPTKSIYYKDKEYFDGYMAYRALQQKTTFSRPELPYFCSNKFSFESWKEVAYERSNSI